MKVLSISTDRKLFEDGSTVLSRSLEYAKKMDELHIVVFTTSQKSKAESKKVGSNLFLYPTNSISKLFYIFDAIKIGSQIIGNWKLKIGNLSDAVLSTQDPFETGFVGTRLKKRFGLPLQIQIHTDFFSSHFKNSILNLARIFLSKIVIAKADGIRVVADFLKESLVKHFPKTKNIIEILPVFVDIEKISNTLPKRGLNQEFPKFKFIILMASRLAKEKRIDIALKAFKNVLIKFPHSGLVIAGSGEQKRALENMVIKLRLENNVVFVGWQKDLVPLYKSADLFLVTSEYEGYGMTLMEAGASGCPIVTTSVGIAKTGLFINGQNSLVCRICDTGCISAGILDIISDNSKRELFKHKMQDSIKSIAISKEKYAEKYVSLLKKLLND
ncbi:MAG: hypothetical protein A3H52_02895 [Candidatus Zambryskibacteria bacterium RIFCSPLOWO2_02_FULL_39_26]|uniref:Glycosyl transferase family 1 domain-containing protein n=1 Tax=Candidatus Zambryskibacteria bacterium RIFCSPLOWO2_12_FULL_39_23 TaxID=1802776 RepID=A0A1G2UUI6_9BACT|nr:MAG: hypothetical protein A2W51_00785 [Candidatus Zambryskibacteria bacterium RIFCSPHIGHO2_02_39_10]OHA99952.1 MAG: hypothetical protein A3E59_01910 [Candidatus Zambryskibacteria bacterium RIFCSPHIGHO2_12_FULL_39_47]OHB10534.1 MAG: hypothetical protein A3H52_02895 [Candidatus Zambryskibacteria bacterium RIFCSPLOWO2_02_FULL_39_26]OHB13060.1 MAG: hypothetical protein A3G99_00510 [Candidatus Zambryskibacteria bacterium RIFCSPLOWO2_12_FULL_39_23]